jgi:two-component system phosphate regulon sensor histidine kinase PhoR
MNPDLWSSPAWQVSLGRFVLLVVVALAAGFIVGHVEAALALAMFGYSAWSLYSLHRFQRWLRSRRRMPPPDNWGVWSDVLEYQYRELRAARSRKRRLVSLIRAFREAADALPDAVIVLDGARRILWFNRAAARLLRLHAPRDRGQRVEDYFHHPAINAWFAGEPQREPLLDVPAPTDDQVRMLLRFIPYAADQSMLVVRDISNLMRLEQVRRDFVANVSHELRTPLTVLHGYLDMMEPEDAPDWAPMLDDLRQQSKRMAQIVEDLLTLSRLEAQEPPADETISMPGMLAALRNEAELLSRGRHTVSITHCDDVDLRGSPQYLTSAFSNLVSNAVRYTPAGGRIELAWRVDADGSAARLSVSDTGYGIPAEHIPRITERFYRVSNSRSRASGGTGLGLSIVKHVLNQHQARLDITSEVGVGSTFTVVFGRARLVEPLPQAAESQ